MSDHSEHMDKKEIHGLSETIAELVEKELEAKSLTNGLSEEDSQRLLDFNSNLLLLLDRLNKVNTSTNFILNNAEYYTLHEEQQINMPSFAIRPDTGAKVPLEDFIFTSLDISAATVDQSGLVTRVSDTKATFITIKVDYVIVDVDIGKVRRSSFIDYVIYQPSISLDITSTEVV